MKNKYEVTYGLTGVDESAPLVVEEIVADVAMAGSDNGVLVLYDYDQPPTPDAPPVPRMRRMFAAGTWRMVQNNGPYLEPVKETK